VNIRPIRTEAEYDAALKAIERFFDDEPALGTPEADEFDLLALVIADYESKHWPIDPPDPIDAIKFHMEQRGLTQSDLARLVGRSRASELLHKRRPLTMENVRKIYAEWKIPPESLIRPYDLAAAGAKPRAYAQKRSVSKPPRVTKPRRRKT
jgi:HTH-type transcriptional regulator/antitoxin HigA